MWGLRAVRVGVLVCGLLALIAGSGCCQCCQNLWKSDKPPAASQQTDAKDEKELRKVQNAWKTYWFNDQPGHLTAERIHGGIY